MIPTLASLKQSEVRMDVRQIAHEIVAREGGYVNDQDDPGGPTKYGVTLATLERLGRDLNSDGTVDNADVRRLSTDQAVEIFVREYFEKPRINELPQPLQASVFDMSVNSGPNAIFILQRLLNDMGQSVKVDGALGPQTLEASEAAAMLAPDHLVDAYGIARRNYYFSLADKRPSLRKFARTQSGQKGGWIKRAEEFISSRYHMSQQEFENRVATWES